MKTKTASRSCQAGFSLLELLLALVVIGMIITLAGLSVSSGSRPYEIETAARNFADIAEYALDEAQLRGADMGVRLEFGGTGDEVLFTYEWLQRVGNIWQTAAMDPDAFGRRELPRNVEVILEIEEEKSDLLQSGDEEDEETVKAAPQVIFFASGETTPGLMSWVDSETGDLLWELEWDLIGRFELRPRGYREEDDADFD